MSIEEKKIELVKRVHHSFVSGNPSTINPTSSPYFSENTLTFGIVCSPSMATPFVFSVVRYDYARNCWWFMSNLLIPLAVNSGTYTTLATSGINKLRIFLFFSAARPR
ncbi:unnamed protein product, partial [Choristocarpus tenellus]